MFVSRAIAVVCRVLCHRRRHRGDTRTCATASATSGRRQNTLRGLSFPSANTRRHASWALHTPSGESAVKHNACVSSRHHSEHDARFSLPGRIRSRLCRGCARGGSPRFHADHDADDADDDGQPRRAVGSYVKTATGDSAIANNPDFRSDAGQVRENRARSRRARRAPGRRAPRVRAPRSQLAWRPAPTSVSTRPRASRRPTSLFHARDPISLTPSRRRRRRAAVAVAARRGSSRRSRPCRRASPRSPSSSSR